MSARINGLYAIIDPNHLPAWKSAVEYTRQILAGGCKIIRLRVNEGKTQRWQIARDIISFKKSYDFTLLIHDDEECAAAVGADGVHFEQKISSLPAARARLGESAILGVSTYCLSDALKLSDAGANYVSFGAMFPTVTRAGVPVQDLGQLAELVESVSLPVVASGGINRSNIESVIATGVHSVAIITGLARASEPSTEAQWYMGQFESVARRSIPSVAAVAATIVEPTS